jgi:hypothetical protein
MYHVLLQEIDENDQAILESFMPNSGGTRNLADLIMEKIQAREAGETPVTEGEYRQDSLKYSLSPDAVFPQ